MYEDKNITITVRIGKSENDKLEEYINKLNKGIYFNKYNKSKVIRMLINDIDLNKMK